MSPANTGPVLTPTRIGMLSWAACSPRSAASMRASSSGLAVGAPATRISLPPSRSTSVPRKVTPCASQAAWAADTSAASASATCSAGREATISSRPS